MNSRKEFIYLNKYWNSKFWVYSVHLQVKFKIYVRSDVLFLLIILKPKKSLRSFITFQWSSKWFKKEPFPFNNIISSSCLSNSTWKPFIQCEFMYTSSIDHLSKSIEPKIFSWKSSMTHSISYLIVWGKKTSFKLVANRSCSKRTSKKNMICQHPLMTRKFLQENKGKLWKIAKG